MERELWPLLYRLLRSIAKDFHQKNVTYQPWVLAAVLLWAALHDRPLSWAANCGTGLLPDCVPCNCLHPLH